MVSDLISDGEKRQALERVIASRTFSRSEQLRGLLRYICEAEFEGRGAGTERIRARRVRPGASVGLFADRRLVRPQPRLRASQQAEELLSARSARRPDSDRDSKGAYVPQFHRTGEVKIAEGAILAPDVHEDPPPAPVIPVPAPKRAYWKSALAILAIAVLLGSGSLYSTRDRIAGRRRGSADLDSGDDGLLEALSQCRHTAHRQLRDPAVFLFAVDRASGRDYQTNQLSDLSGSKPLRSVPHPNGDQGTPGDVRLCGFRCGPCGVSSGSRAGATASGDWPETFRLARMGRPVEQQRSFHRQTEPESHHSLHPKEYGLRGGRVGGDSKPASTAGGAAGIPQRFDPWVGREICRHQRVAGTTVGPPRHDSERLRFRVPVGVGAVRHRSCPR